MISNLPFFLSFILFQRLFFPFSFFPLFLLFSNDHRSSFGNTPVSSPASKVRYFTETTSRKTWLQVSKTWLRKFHRGSHRNAVNRGQSTVDGDPLAPKIYCSYPNPIIFDRRDSFSLRVRADSVSAFPFRLLLVFVSAACSRNTATIKIMSPI